MRSSDEETDDNSIEPDPSNLELQESGLSPLSSSPYSEDTGVAGDNGEHYNTISTLSHTVANSTLV